MNRKYDVYAVLRRLRVKSIRKKAGTLTGIGCPFSQEYNGPMYNIFDGHICEQLCGELYPDIKSNPTLELWDGSMSVDCPCSVYKDKDTVSEIFWRELKKARKGEDH